MIQRRAAVTNRTQEYEQDGAVEIKPALMPILVRVLSIPECPRNPTSGPS
jgi:hypothetical protein